MVLLGSIHNTELARTALDTWPMVPSVFTATGLAVCAFFSFRHALRKRRGLPQRDPALGYASVLFVDWVNRDEDVIFPSLSQVLRLRQSGQPDIPVTSLVAQRDVMLYKILPKRRLLLFLKVETRGAVRSELFLDQAIRKHAGDMAWLVTYDTVDRYIRQAAENFRDRRDVLFLYSSGMSGATLLHRLLESACVCSLSEPEWFDQLCYLRDKLPPEDLQLLVRVCLTLDWHMALRHQSSGAQVVAINPKACAHVLYKAIKQEFPNARHLFMYRDGISMVESFTSFVATTLPPITRCAARRLGRFSFLLGARAPREFPIPETEELQNMAETGRLSKIMPSNILVAHFALLWCDAMLFWKGVLETEDSQPTSRMTVRYDDFVDQNLDNRRAVVRRVLEWAALRPMDDGELNKILRVLHRDTQERTKIRRPSRRRQKPFLIEKDRNDLRYMGSNIPGLGTMDYYIEGSIAP